MTNNQPSLTGTTYHEIVIDPAKDIEVYPGFDNVYINTNDGQRFVLTKESYPQPDDFFKACNDALINGNRLYLAFSAQPRGYIPRIYDVKETTLDSMPDIPVPVSQERTGTVLQISGELGTGRVQEDKTGTIFSIVKKFTDAGLFDQLVELEKQGSSPALKFRDNGSRAIVAFEILKP